MAMKNEISICLADIPSSSVTQDPLVSIIVPVYNVEKYVAECLGSLEAQSYRNLEVIVVDDGSTDSSMPRVEPFLNRLRRTKVYSYPNRGLGAARNVGLNLAAGEFITFVDSDDYVSSDYVESMIECQRQGNFDIVSCDLQKVTEAGDPIDEIKRPSSEVAAFSEYARILGVYDLSVSCGRLYRTDFLKSSGIRFPNRCPHEDMFFTYKIFSCAQNNVARINRGLYKWRQREGSLGRSLSPSHIDAMNSLRDDTKNFLDQRGASLLEKTLAARRNIVFLNTRKNGVSGSRELEEYFFLNVSKSALQIREDIRAMEGVGLRIGYDHAFVDDAVARSDLAVTRTAHKIVDVVFLPMRKYHLDDCVPVADSLRRSGFSVQIVSTDHYRKSGESVAAYCRDLGVEFLNFADFIQEGWSPRCIIFWNDWEPFMRVIADACRRSGVETIGWVEGIQDYLDSDLGMNRKRSPYRRVMNVLVPGRFDKKYFIGSGQNIIVGEVVRIGRLWREYRDRQPEAKKRALINSNFSYGVLEDKRDEWVSEAVEACLSAGFQPVISRHPFDKGGVYGDYETTDDFYTALRGCQVSIQRFASGILESLAMRVPVVYFNPHGEQVDKFRDPHSALSHCFDRLKLASILRNVEFGWCESGARAYLEDHCALDPSLRPGERMQEAISDILNSSPRVYCNFAKSVKEIVSDLSSATEFVSVGRSIQAFFPDCVAQGCGQDSVLSTSEEFDCVAALRLSSCLLLDPGYVAQVDLDCFNAFFDAQGSCGDDSFKNHLAQVYRWAKTQSPIG